MMNPRTRTIAFWIILILSVVLVSSCFLIAGWKAAFAAIGIYIVLLSIIIGGAFFLFEHFLKSNHKLILASTFLGLLVFTAMLVGFPLIIYSLSKVESASFHLWE